MKVHSIIFLFAFITLGFNNCHHHQINENLSSPITQVGVIHIATCQFPVSAHVKDNADWIRSQINLAKKDNADVVHFSEAALTGYAGINYDSMTGYDWETHDRELQSILDLAKSLEIWVVLGSAHRLSEGNKPHNSLYVINNHGKIIDRYDKRFCTTGDLNHYSPGDHFTVFEINGVKCGLLICYDIRFPELFRQYHKLGIQVLFHSFHNALQKPGSIHPKIMPPTAQARAATNNFFISMNNSSAKHSWESLFITPDGLIQKRLKLDQPGVMVNTADTTIKYYDASRRYRDDSIAGKLNSGETINDPRSTNRTGY